jgi:N-acylneuraminate cytidylyltransferase
MALAEKGGCEAPFRREAALATNESSSVDVVVDALQRVPNYDIVVLLQPTSPLRSTEDIDAALDLLRAKDAPSCVSVRPAIDHPYLTFRIDASGQLAPFAESISQTSMRRQDFPPAWCLNGAIYAARVAWFLRERTFISPQTQLYYMPPERSLDIDTLEDLEQFRLIAERS